MQKALIDKLSLASKESSERAKVYLAPDSQVVALREELLEKKRRLNEILEKLQNFNLEVQIEDVEEDAGNRREPVDDRQEAEPNQAPPDRVADAGREEVDEPEDRQQLNVQLRDDNNVRLVLDGLDAAPAPAPWAEWGSEAALPGVLGVELEEKVTDHHSLHHLPPDQLLHL